MLLEDLFRNVIENIVLKFWSQEEKEALLKILYEIYNIDHEFSIEEVKHFNDKLNAINVDSDRIKTLPLKDAVKILQTDKLKKDLIYIVLAEAIFKDEDYDMMERSYIEKIIQEYDIDEKKLKGKIKEIRDKKFEKVLKGWIKEIKSGKYI